MSSETLNSSPQEPAKNRPVIEIPGAYEVFKGTRENLLSLSRSGRLLRAGDELPNVKGYDPESQTYVDLPRTGVIHFVNEFATPSCDNCTRTAERLQTSYYENVTVFSVGKMRYGTKDVSVSLEDEEGKEIGHQRVLIGHEDAIDLGVALAPGEGADEEFWNGALRRGVVAVVNGEVVFADFPNDQEKAPSIISALQVASYETARKAQE